MPRFNSWDSVTGPYKVVVYLFRSLLDACWDAWSLAVMAVAFAVIAAVYWPLKQITLAMLLGNVCIHG